MQSIAIKMTSGREILGFTNHHKVEFGIKEYKGKIPRKVFFIQVTPDDEPEKFHMLRLEKAIEVMLIPDVGIRLISIYSSLPALTQGESNFIGIPLNIHSNDVIGINTSVAPELDMAMRKTVGLINAVNTPAVNFPDQRQ